MRFQDKLATIQICMDFLDSIGDNAFQSNWVFTSIRGDVGNHCCSLVFRTTASQHFRVHFNRVSFRSKLLKGCKQWTSWI